MNNWIAVQFDEKHNYTLGKGLKNLDIIRADKWIHREDDGEQGSKYNENVNYLETHPQICTVIYENQSHPYKRGDKLFVHYMAYETAEAAFGEDCENATIIDCDFIFFKILDGGSFEMKEGIYLGEQQYTEEEVRPSGIIIGGNKKEALKIRITHIPESPPKWHKEHPIKVNDLILSIDDKNYELNFWGKRYVKLRYDEIAIIMMDNKPTPIS